MPAWSPTTFARDLAALPVPCARSIPTRSSSARGSKDAMAEIRYARLCGAPFDAYLHVAVTDLQADPRLPEPCVGSRPSLYSRRNLVGSLLAIGGLALHFVGSWPVPIRLPITVGPLLIGSPGRPRGAGTGASAGRRRGCLGHPGGPAAAPQGAPRPRRRRPVRQDGEHRGIDPGRSLEIESGAGDAHGPERSASVRWRSYLPATTFSSSYLRMPRIMAERRAIAGGRTPRPRAPRAALTSWTGALPTWPMTSPATTPTSCSPIGRVFWPRSSVAARSTSMPGPPWTAAEAAPTPDRGRGHPWAGPSP